MVFLYFLISDGLLTVPFLTCVMARCDWPYERNDYDNCFSSPLEFHCSSTVNYDHGICVELQKNDGYRFKVILENPNENPFLENITFYTDLTIKDGYLVTILGDIFNMVQLTSLEISGNKLRKINLNDFLPLQRLKKLDLAYNTIIVIETQEKLSSYGIVQEIDLSYNFIETIPNNFITRFRELEHLNMSHNMISNIGEHAFEGTVQLKTLDLSHNKLQEVGSIFTQLPKLIDSNYATSKNLQKLSQLVLDVNTIVNVNFTEFFDTGIPELSIGGNQIPCNELAAVKYSKFSEKFDRIVTAINLNFDSHNINGISCLNEVVDVINVSDNPKSNSSILVSLFKNAIENNSQSIYTLVEIVNQNQKKIDQFIESSNSMLSNINEQLTDIKNNLPDKPVSGIVMEDVYSR